jgi:hypothetical protein
MVKLWVGMNKTINKHKRITPDSPKALILAQKTRGALEMAIAKD